jgi:hypothetical protein
MEESLVASRASSKERGGRMEGSRLASMVLPEPGGPTRSTLWSERPQSVAILVRLMRVGAYARRLEDLLGWPKREESFRHHRPGPRLGLSGFPIRKKSAQ